MKYKRPTVIYSDLQASRENSIVRYIGHRILNQNKNFLCALTGGTGEGKSWAAVSIAEIYSKMFNINFDPKIHVIHSLKQILQLITSKNLDEKLGVGSILIFEEMQVEGNSRNWQSESNKGLNRLVSTFRDRRLAVLFTTPILSFIDKQSRMHFHAEFEVLGYNKNTKMTTIKPRFLYPKHNISRGDDFYRKCMLVKYKIPEKERLLRYKLSEWAIPKASAPLLEEYEKLKKAFNDKLTKMELKKIELSEKQAQGKNKAEDLFRLKDLYERYGEDYLQICKKMPHISPMSIEKMILLIKRANKAMISRAQ